MTTRTVEGTVRWAIDRLEARPYHQGARALLETVATGAALYARDAREALACAEQARAQQPPPAERDPDDWPAGWAR